MSLAKKLGKQPPEVAQAIVERLQLEDMLAPPAIAGPGFINLSLHTDWLARQVRHMASDDRLGVAPVEAPRTFVIDFSSPNVAKPMHVGHLRSTIIGDALARLLRFLGHKVVTDNHLGDWGTQFGILLYGYKHFLDEKAFAVRSRRRVGAAVCPCPQADQEDRQRAGRRGRRSGRSDRAAAREETAKLHAGDEENLRLWQEFMPHCYEEIERIYRRLDVHFDHRFGESFYHPMLADVVGDLRERGIARESEGAIAVFFGDNDSPALIQKRDGAYTYTTTDLATIRYRLEQWHPDAILYVVDFRQGLHFKQLFDIVRRWGYDRVELQHISFGSVLGEDGRPISTREGTGALLDSLLNEAVAAAASVHEQNQQDDKSECNAEERRAIHEVVGIGAVKYADLSQNRTSDYRFSLKKMLAMDGNTATYMQYAYVRNRSIFRRGNVDVLSLRRNPPPVILSTSEERALALQLLRFHDAMTAAAAEYKPSLITAYLWDLAKTYSGFFQNCPVLKAETAELRQSRLLLCDLTARVIQRGLDLLGICTVERM